MSNAMLSEAEKALRARGGALSESDARLTLPDVVVASGACLAFALAGSALGWAFLSGSVALYMALLVGALVLGVVIARKSPVGPALALAYSAVLGLIVGAFSSAAASTGGGWGLIVQALVGTLSGTIAMFVLYSTPWGRKASRAVRLFAGLALGYLVLSVASIVSSFFGVGDGWGLFGVGGLGIALCLFGVALACWSLLVDIGSVESALAMSASRQWMWSLGVGLVASVVWMYLEILRLLAISRS